MPFDLILSTNFLIKTFAQSTYKTATGLGIDFGEGSAIVGPSIKHFFNDNKAITAEAEALFSDYFNVIGALYQYHQSFKEAKELKWYLGLVPEILFNKRGVEFALRPMTGLDYKVKTLSLSLTLNWRPYFLLTRKYTLL